MELSLTTVLRCAATRVLKRTEAFLKRLWLPQRRQHRGQSGALFRRAPWALQLGGQPLLRSRAGLATAAVNQLQRSCGRYGLCTMCRGVGQGIAVVLERL